MSISTFEWGRVVTPSWERVNGEIETVNCNIRAVLLAIIAQIVLNTNHPHPCNTLYIPIHYRGYVLCIGVYV